MDTLTIGVTAELAEQLEQEASSRGQSVEELARKVLEERFAPAARAARRDRNQAAIALLREWRQEPPDLEEAEGYPTGITPLSLREVRID